MMTSTHRHWSPLAVLLLAVVLFSGCDHITDPDGPNLIDRFGDFFVIEPLAASTEEVDFAAGQTVVFTAVFNKQVNWIIEITGQESGAVKRITGFSRELTAANARWDGSATELPLFRAEDVHVVLRIPDEEGAEPQEVAVAVLSEKAYTATVIVDFEQPSPHIRLGNFEFELDANTGRQTVPAAAQGEWFYRLGGTDNVVRNFFVGLIDVLPAIGGNTYFPVPTSVPEDLYFNMMLYSYGTPNTIAVVQLIADANGNGVFDDGQDTVLPFGDVRMDWPGGWRLFSKSFAELGITQAQAQVIVAVRIILISDDNQQPTPPLPVEFGIDYLTFTSGTPFIP